MIDKENVFDTNDIISCFKMSVDVNGIKRIEEYINKLEQENQQLKEKINTYENPEDMTLMHMWCDEKAKDKIKQLKEVIEEVKTEISSLMSKYFYEKDFCIEDIHLDKLLQILDKVKEQKND